MIKKSGNGRPPVVAAFIFKQMFRNDGSYQILGDMEEEYNDFVDEQGVLYAKFWYWLQLATSFFPRIFDSIYWRYKMLKENFKLAFRHMKKNKWYSFINIMGLAVGIACSIIIILYVNNELSYDTSYPDYERIYRVAEHRIVPLGEFFYAASCPPLGPALVENYPQIESAARLRRMTGGAIRSEESNFIEQSIWYASTEIFEMFDVHFIYGNRKKALTEPNSAVLTESISKKLFGEINPVGETFEITTSNGMYRVDNTYKFEVVGVVDDAPQNTHIKYNLLLSFENINDIYENMLDEWHTGGTYTYIKVAEGTDPVALEAEVSDIAYKYVGNDLKKWGQTREYFIQPLKDIHLKSKLQRETEPSGNYNYIYTYSIIAFMILLIACMNFINLSAVRSSTRSREVGLRKVVGAYRHQLISQFLSESIFTTIFAFVLAFAIAHLMLPVFNNLAGTQLELINLNQPIILYSLLGLILAIGIGSGGYPAFILTAFRPIFAIQGATNPGSKGSFMIRTLVIGQFAISILLIIGTITVYKQLDYMKTGTLGFDKEQKLVLSFKSNREHFRKNYQSISNEFKQLSGVESATASSSVPGSETLRTAFRIKGEGHSWPVSGYANPERINFLSMDNNFVQDFGITMLAGRPFEENVRYDENNAFLINEAALAQLGFENAEEAIGFEMYETYYTRVKKIVGVTSNFHYQGLQQEVEPLLVEYSSSRFYGLTLSLNSGDTHEIVKSIENRWAELFPEAPIRYHFLDDVYDRQYRYEHQVSKTLGLMAMLGLVISCLGLQGLALFIAQSRKKEIGIRKVMGASIGNIVKLLSKQFIALIVVASLIASPVAWLIMNRWLQDFAYRIDIGWVIFGIAIGATLIIAGLTVSLQGLRAATTNPVEELRHE